MTKYKTWADLPGNERETILGNIAEKKVSVITPLKRISGYQWFSKPYSQANTRMHFVSFTKLQTRKRNLQVTHKHLEPCPTCPTCPTTGINIWIILNMGNVYGCFYY